MCIFTMIGIILLMGLVTKNGILLVDSTNTLRRREGMERDAAILKAGPTRLRPILMTTFAMIFGMLPIALGMGPGSESRAPMAVAVIGGLTTSTLLTQVVVPVVYTLLDDLSHPGQWRAGACGLGIDGARAAVGGRLLGSRSRGGVVLAEGAPLRAAPRRAAVRRRCRRRPAAGRFGVALPRLCVRGSPSATPMGPSCPGGRSAGSSDVAIGPSRR